MNINRHNYEELFLLYIDGELDAVQKQLVEAFAAANPDLKEELDMLKETVLFTDNDLVFADKSSLYKSLDAASITTHNYEEHFLLYVDNELEQPAKTGVETFVLQHPELQDQFTVLKQTKLEAEHIACPNKELLYKEEKERRPVVFMWAKRLAIAAAILLFAVMAWMLTSNNKQTADGPTVAKANGSSVEKNSASTVTSTTTVPLSTGTKTDDTVEPQQTIQHSLADVATQGNKSTEKLPVKTVVEPVQKTLPTNSIAKADNNSTNNSSNGLTVAQPQQKQEAIIAAVIPNKSTEQPVHTVASNSKTESNSPINTKVANTNTASLMAQPAVYRELNTADEDDESKSVYIGSMQISKTKLNGFFKKAKKIFGKSKSEDAPTEESPNTHSRSLR